MRLTRPQLGRAILSVLAAAALGIALVAAGCGCGTARQHMYAGHSFDVASTAVMLNQEVFYEANNPMADNAESLIVTKIMLIAVTELGAWLYPAQADKFYKFSAFVGYTYGAWNTGLMIDK